MLVVGAACSGTTWVAETLTRIADLPYVYEPDNPLLEPYAVVTRSGLRTYPAIRSDADAPDDYTRLWDVALGRRHRLLPAGRARRLSRHVPVAEKLGELDPIPADAESTTNATTDDLSPAGSGGAALAAESTGPSADPPSRQLGRTRRSRSTGSSSATCPRSCSSGATRSMWSRADRASS